MYFVMQLKAVLVRSVTVTLPFFGLFFSRISLEGVQKTKGTPPSGILKLFLEGRNFQIWLLKRMINVCLGVRPNPTKNKDLALNIKVSE